MPLVSTAISSLADEGSRFRIGTLLYFRDQSGRILLIRRQRSPNMGLWCAVGGKLEMPKGESPFECACREAGEEVGVTLESEDLTLRCILSEKDYEGTGHWLMFVFQVLVPLEVLPRSIDEGDFRFFELGELDSVQMPEMDREILVGRILKDERSLHVLRSDGYGLQLIEEVRFGGGE